MRLITLLKAKNKCLLRFLETSYKFLSELEIGDFGELEKFERRREVILKALDLYDRKISETAVELRDEQKGGLLLEQIRVEIENKKSMLEKIKVVDSKIVSKLKEEQERVSRELASSKKSRKIVSKFKSGRDKTMAGAGSKLDSKV